MEFEKQERIIINEMIDNAKTHNEKLPIDIYDFFPWLLFLYVGIGFSIWVIIGVNYPNIDEVSIKMLLYLFMLILPLLLEIVTAHLILFIMYNVPLNSSVIYKNQKVKELWTESPYNEINLYIKKEKKKLIVYDKHSLMENEYDYKINVDKNQLRVVLINILKNKYISEKDVEYETNKKLKIFKVEFDKQYDSDMKEKEKQKIINEKLKYLNS